MNLTDDFLKWTNPESPEFDPEFTEQIRRCRPDWLENPNMIKHVGTDLQAISEQIQNLPVIEDTE